MEIFRLACNQLFYGGICLVLQLIDLFDGSVQHPSEGTLLVTGGQPSTIPEIRNFLTEEIECNRITDVSAKDEKTQTFVGCGQSFEGQTIAIVNPETLIKCAPDQIGEIWISSPSVTQGYWDQPNITRKRQDAC